LEVTFIVMVLVKDFRIWLTVIKIFWKIPLIGMQNAPAKEFVIAKLVYVIASMASLALPVSARNAQ